LEYVKSMLKDLRPSIEVWGVEVYLPDSGSSTGFPSREKRLENKNPRISDETRGSGCELIWRLITDDAVHSNSELPH
jgi:hypothetical protein